MKEESGWKAGPTSAGPRSAFTLLELLVVVAIVGILVALSTSAVFKFISTQRTASTRAALGQIATRLDTQWSEVTRKAHDEPLPSYLLANPDFLAMVGGDTHDVARARVVYIKLRQRQAFPMTFDEALNPAPLPRLKPYAVYLNDLGVARSTSQTAPYESAICLLMALERSPGSAGVKAEDLGGTATLALPGGEARYLVDYWRTPLAFCRWPTGDQQLNPQGPSPGRNDPDDAEGLLNIPAWLATPGAPLFRRLCHDLPARATGAGPSSYRLAPLVVSAGPDRDLALDPRTFRPLGPGANDNLSSNRVR
jgi:prepilin-type N-terminal cleavage/methylation domain-containing protein